MKSKKKIMIDWKKWQKKSKQRVKSSLDRKFGKSIESRISFGATFSAKRKKK